MWHVFKSNRQKVDAQLLFSLNFIIPVFPPKSEFDLNMKLLFYFLKQLVIMNKTCL